MTTKGQPTTVIPERYRDLGLPSEKGGFGVGKVLLDTWLERRVFLKTIPDGAARAQLTREVKSIVGVRSKHVVAIYELLRDKAGTVHGIIYEYLSGAELQYGSFARPAPLAGFLTTIYQLACGIADIHAAGIVHRDIKLGNVKRDAEGIVKIFDFGISSTIGDVTHASRGTRIFLAPELFTPPAKISPALDVYAFGVCCWALLTDKPPAPLFELPPQSKTPMPNVNSVRPDLPPRIADTIDLCLAKDLGVRPTSTKVREILANELTRDKHRAVFRGLEQPVELNASNRVVRLGSGSLGRLRIEYDGLNIKISAVEGAIYVNNVRATVGQPLEDSCVIAFGAPEHGAARKFVEINMSSPEVVL